VCNAAFRLGALFCETIARKVSEGIPNVDLVNDSSKDIKIEERIKSAFESSSESGNVVCFDNSDQKRWGPNHNVNFFAASLYSYTIEEPGLLRMCIAVFDKVFKKLAKYPETLIHLIKEKKVVDSKARDIDAFIKFAKKSVDSGIFEEELPMGMCQGILHAMSSIHHATMAKALEDVIKRALPYVNVDSMVTSDDAERIIEITKKQDYISTVRVIHTYINIMGNLFNIMRNNSKSSFNFIIAELNSIFIKKGSLATPSIKQRIAKIDVGNGINHVEDYLDGLSSASNYLAQGGSYMGAYIISILNLTLHTEQWLRWSFANSDNYRKPVELGGFPMIEPISTLMAGPIASSYLRASYCLQPDEYAKLYTNTLLAPPEQFNLADFARGNNIKKSLELPDITIIKSAGPLGMFQLARTDKKLSQFERRHWMSQWPIPDSFASLNRSDSAASSLIFSIFRNCGMSIMETSQGVNSFFIRFVHPWVSHTRNCYKISESSPFKNLISVGSDFISHKDLMTKLSSISPKDAAVEMKNMSNSVTENDSNRILIAQLRMRLDDASELLNFLRKQSAETFRTIKLNSTISKVTLRGHSAIDSSDYSLTLLKALSGKNAKGIINKTRHSIDTYDSIDVREPEHPLKLLDGIIQTDNTSSLFEKFVRRSTKLICPIPSISLVDLCTGMLKNHFTESIGIVLEDKLNLSGEIQGALSYNVWMQKLLDNSKSYESSLANDILSGLSITEPKLNIISRGINISGYDKFEITKLPQSTKSKTIHATNRDTLVSQLKAWLSANVNVYLSLQTIHAFTQGKLCFSHDYYIGDGRFTRYAKDKYLSVVSSGIKGLHMIDTVKKTFNGAPATSYRHTFIFPTKIHRAQVSALISSGFENEAWVSNLVNSINKITSVVEGNWYEVPKINMKKTRRRGVPDDVRRTFHETDYIRFMSFSPADPFEIDTVNDSLVVFLSLMRANTKYKFPVTYLTANKIDSLSLGYTLTHEDAKEAMTAYVDLMNMTSDFDMTYIRRDPVLTSFLDFTLVNSSTSTPDWRVSKESNKVGIKISNSISFDIFRAALISNSSFGVNIATSRFNQFLLNMCKRRKHEHSYLSRTIAGTVADTESELDIDDDEEEIILMSGESYESTVTSDDVNANSDNMVGNLLYQHEDHEGIKSLREVVQHRIEFAESAAVEAGSQPLADFLFDADDYVSSDDEITASLNPESDKRVASDSDSGIMSNFDVDEVLETFLDAAGVTKTNSPHSIRSLNNSPSINSYESGNDAITKLFDDFLPEFEMNFDDDSDNELVANEDVINIADQVMNQPDVQYSKVRDITDETIVSVITSKTINPALENPRSIIKYIKNWLSTAGAVTKPEFAHFGVRNLASIPSLYLAMQGLAGSMENNAIQRVTGEEYFHLPVELTALVVIDKLYSNF